MQDNPNRAQKELPAESPPLEGIRVLDLSHAAAAPFASMMLGDMGAEVIKVERPGTGDLIRRTGSLLLAGESVMFYTFNRSKKSITVDLLKEEGREIIFKLARISDVFLENFQPDFLTNLGLDYDNITQVNPRIIYCSLSAFGQRGPYRNRIGFDPIAQAMGGTMSLTGEKGGPPLRTGIAMADLEAGRLAAYGILLALFVRERRGIGQKVETSLFEGQVSNLHYKEMEYFVTGQNPPRMGNAVPQVVPYQTFQTKDNEYIYIGAATDKFWHNLCTILKVEHLATDPRFDTPIKRNQNREELIPILEDIFRQKSLEEWLEILEGKDIPYGPVLTLDRLFKDPHTMANDMLVTINHPVVGEIKTIGIPVKLSKTPGKIKNPPPTLGQHTEEILGELGYTRTQIDKLRDKGVI